MPLIELVPPRVLPRGHCSLAASRTGLAFAEEVPVDLSIVENAQNTGGDMDPDVAVGRPGFEQHNARALFAQSGGHHTPGRAGPDNNVIRIHLFSPTASPTGAL